MLPRLLLVLFRHQLQHFADGDGLAWWWKQKSRMSGSGKKKRKKNRSLRVRRPPPTFVSQRESPHLREVFESL